MYRIDIMFLVAQFIWSINPQGSLATPDGMTLQGMTDVRSVCPPEDALHPISNGCFYTSWVTSSWILSSRCILRGKPNLNTTKSIFPIAIQGPGPQRHDFIKSCSLTSHIYTFKEMRKMSCFSHEYWYTLHSKRKYRLLRSPPLQHVYI